MKLFELKELTRGKTPDGADFRAVKKEITSIVESNSGILTHALYWGSATQEKWKRTSDIDLVFLYRINYTPLITILLARIQEIAHERNVPFECMCLPIELHFGKRKIDLSKLSALLEYHELETSLICGKRNLSFELFGYTQDVIKSSDDFRLEMYRAYIDYVLHKLDKWMREFTQWNHLSEENKLKIAGKFISAPAHAMRRKVQSERFNSIGFEENILQSRMDDDVISAYTRVELLKDSYLEVLRSFENSNSFYVHYELFMKSFLPRIMEEVGEFFKLSASKI